MKLNFSCYFLMWECWLYYIKLQIFRLENDCQLEFKLQNFKKMRKYHFGKKFKKMIWITIKLLTLVLTSSTCGYTTISTLSPLRHRFSFLIWCIVKFFFFICIINEIVMARFCLVAFFCFSCLIYIFDRFRLFFAPGLTYTYLQLESDLKFKK